MLKVNTKISYNDNNDISYIILGSKAEPFKIKISDSTSYFIYPPYGFDYVIGDETLENHQISDLTYVKESEIKVIPIQVNESK